MGDLMRWLTLLVALCAALSVWTLAQADAALSIRIESLNDYCEVKADGSGAISVNWVVTGGQEPYEVWVAGEWHEGSSGVASVQCIGLGVRNTSYYRSPYRSISLQVTGIVEDRDGTRASELIVVPRLVTVVIPMEDDRQLIGPGWFRSYGQTFWLPAGLWRVSEVDGALKVQAEDVRWWPPLWIVEIVPEPFLVPDVLRTAVGFPIAELDRMADSVGHAPPRWSQSLGDGAETLSLELFAPAVCEASGWSRRSDRHGFSYSDRRVAEVQWRVSGGQEPYTIYIGEQIHVGASGRLRIRCQAFTNGVLDSGLISVAGFVEDANGATGSGIVQTYAVAERSGNRYSEQQRLNRGRTYRFWGILMTIPQGLEIDAGRIGFTNVSCDPECENFFSVSTTGGSIWADFGENTGQMIGREIGDDWREDPGVNADSEAEIRAMMDQWADSVGKGPDLSEAPWINPTPLQISGYLDSLNCLPRPQRDRLQTGARINVSGGAWVPTGIEVNGTLVGLARGTAQIRVPEIPCTGEPGWRTLTLNVHDVEPDDASAEIDLRVLNLPGRYWDGSLRILASAWQSEREQTPYCEPGSDVLIKWELRGAVEPLAVYVDGQRQGEFEVWQTKWQKETRASGHARVPCLNRSGFQAHTIWAIDSASTPQRVMIPIILQAVAEHPSGRSWSDLRATD